MIKQKVIDRVIGLIGLGLPQREIAKRAGTNRYAVAAVVNGLTVERKPKPKPPAAEVNRLAYLRVHGCGVNAEKCPTCGGMVYAPCVLCHVRSEA